jgi:hypothetical protein
MRASFEARAGLACDKLLGTGASVDAVQCVAEVVGEWADGR